MNILLLCHRSIEETLRASGVAEFINLLPPALAAQGIKNYIYTPNATNKIELSPPATLKNNLISYSGPFPKPSLWTRKKTLSPAMTLCKKEKIDLIHAQGTYRCGFLAWQLHKLTGIPYVVTSHSDISPGCSGRMHRPRVIRRCKKILTHAARVTHLTPYFANTSHTICDTRHKSLIIENGIDVETWQPFIHSSEKNYLVSIGRLVPEKGFDILIAAYAKLRQRGFTTLLKIAGTGSAENSLRQQVQRLGLTDYVEFTGYVRDDAKRKLIAESQMMLFATQPHLWEEAFGIVHLEAMAAGKALIASDTNAARYLQTLGLNAVLVKADDVDAWADKIASVLQDDALRKTMGANNLANVARFCWGNIAKQYIEAYRAATLSIQVNC